MAARPPRLGPFSVRLELGLAAFYPAFALLAFRSRETAWAWGFLGVGFLCALCVIHLILAVNRGNPEAIRFADIKDLSGDLLGHISTYLVPAFVDTSESTEAVVVSVAIMALILHVHVATGRVHVNPVLYALGYRVYTASTSGGATFYVLAQTDVADWGSAVSCVQVGQALLIEKSRGDAS
jgi:hypothetical protein